MTCVQPVIVRNAVFCKFCSFAIFVVETIGDHIVEAFSSVGSVTTL